MDLKKIKMKLKDVLSDVLNHDTSNTLLSVRMSDILNTSVVSDDILEPLHENILNLEKPNILEEVELSHPDRLEDDLSQLQLLKEEEQLQQLDGGEMRRCDDNEEEDAHADTDISTNPIQDIADSLTRQKNERRSLKVSIPKLEDENYILDKEHKRNTHLAPVMGKVALLKKANVDLSDYVVIQDLVLEKYSSLISHYVDKIERKRKSRCESFEEFLLTVSSQNSPIETPGSLDRYETGFRFPNCEETKKYNTLPCHQEDRDVISNGFLNSEVAPNNDTDTESISYEDELSDTSNDKDRCVKSYIDTSENSATLDAYTTATDNVVDSYQAFNTCSSLLNEVFRTPKYNCNEKSIVDSSFSYDTTFSNSTLNASDFDPEKFIDNAISDVTIYHDMTNSRDTINTTKSNCIKDNLEKNSSITTSKISDLVSKNSTVDDNFVMERSRIKTTCLYGDFETLNPKNFELECLNKELSIQNEILLQVSKALNYCKTSKDFQRSAEYVEAEKILLLASLSKKALMEDINAIEFDGYYSRADGWCAGEVRIEDIEIRISKDAKYCNEDMEKVYVVVVRSGRQVQSSSIQAPLRDRIRFGRRVTFKNLPTDFHIEIDVYALDVQKKKEHQPHCPSPKNLFLLHRYSKKSNTLNRNQNLNVTSAFTLCGRSAVRISDLKRTMKDGSLVLKMQQVSRNGNIVDDISMNVSSKLRLNSYMRGFLTVGTENEQRCIIWNRRWCILEDAVLRYWNYPNEEEFKPIATIDMKECVTNHVSSADRNVCSRPRTLMLPIRRHNLTIKRYFLSTDDVKDFDMWDRELNFTVQSLNLWSTAEVVKRESG